MSARSVGWASSIDVLPLDRVVERRGGYVAVRSPSNPSHYWGNFLLFDKPPCHGDASRWEALFEDAFGEEQRFVIVADREYHALGLYESLGFERAEHHFGACRSPAADTPGEL